MNNTRKNTTHSSKERILSCLKRESPDRLMCHQIAERIGLSRSQTFTILAALVKEQLIERSTTPGAQGYRTIGQREA